MRNVILDLDGTLISSISFDEMRDNDELKNRVERLLDTHRAEVMDDDYVVFARPDLERLLDYVFKNFNVSVWTAASKSYALFIIDKFILNKMKEEEEEEAVIQQRRRILDGIFFSHHCKKSIKRTGSQKNLEYFCKSLTPDYNPDETVIIDDSPEVQSTQPNKCLRVKEYDVSLPSYERDVEIMRHILPQLRMITNE